jgi:hypothetical protein
MIFAVNAYSQTINRPGSNAGQEGRIAIDRSKVLTPVELLGMRVDAIEKAVNDRVKKGETRVTALEAKILALETQIVESEKTMGDRVARLEWDVNNPSGQIGMSKKIAQKAGWDRIPNGAWFVYYTR